MRVGFRRTPLLRPAALTDEHRGPVDRRRAEAGRLVEAGSDAASRVTVAPPGYVLVHGSSDIARHCDLLSPVPQPFEVRVVATPGRERGEWRVDVATRDRPGLLAAFTGVLATAGIDVVQAVLATWDDGAALEAFVVRCDAPPDVQEVQHAFVASLADPLRAGPIDDATVTFDNSASALYTRCDVRASDRPGLLHALAVAIAGAGADVHAARVTTADGQAHDVFDLSDPAGRKLDPDLADAIRERLCVGTAIVSR